MSQIKDSFKSTMKAIVVHKPGDSSEMKYEEIPIPEPGEREVSAIVPSRVWRWEGGVEGSLILQVHRTAGVTKGPAACYLNPIKPQPHFQRGNSS